MASLNKVPLRTGSRLAVSRLPPPVVGHRQGHESVPLAPHHTFCRALRPTVARDHLLRRERIAPHHRFYNVAELTVARELDR